MNEHKGYMNIKNLWMKKMNEYTGWMNIKN